jgi:hypothetical protein
VTTAGEARAVRPVVVTMTAEVTMMVKTDFNRDCVGNAGIDVASGGVQRGKSTNLFWSSHSPLHCPKSSAYFREIPRSVYIWEQVPWPVYFRRRFNPSLFRNFPKHITLLPSEISKKSREEKKVGLAGFTLLTF